MNRLLNLTPHALHIYNGADPTPLTIPSDGDLRLKSTSSNSTLSHIHPFHYVNTPSGVEVAISIIHAQVFIGLDDTSPGFKLLSTLSSQDAVVVSMPVAQWLSNNPASCKAHILSPGTGKESVVRFGDEDPNRKGQIKGVKALEYHEKIMLPQ